MDIDINRAGVLTPEVEARIDELVRYAPWDEEQVTRGGYVREALAHAMKAIVANVEPSPSRSRALNNLLDARMLANQAITFRGKV